MYPPPQVSNYIAELFKPDSPAFGELWLDGEKVNNQKIQIIIIIKLCVCVCVCVCDVLWLDGKEPDDYA